MVWIRRRLWSRQHGRRRRHPRPCPRTALNLGGTSRFASGTARHHAASPPADWQRQSAAPTRAPRTHGEGISTPSGGILGHVTTRSSRETCPIPPERPSRCLDGVPGQTSLSRPIARFVHESSYTLGGSMPAATASSWTIFA